MLFLPDALHCVTSSEGSHYTSFVFPAWALELLPGQGLSAAAVTARTDASIQQVAHFDGRAPWHAEIVECLGRVRSCVMGGANSPAARYRAVSYLCAAWGCYIANADAEALPKAAIRRSDRLRGAISFIEGHFSEPIGVADIARAANASEASLVRCFREALATTPISYLRDVRLDHATKMLADSGVPLSLVAARCGFADSSHFSHAFKRKMGMTPSGYRKALGA